MCEYVFEKCKAGDVSYAITIRGHWDDDITDTFVYQAMVDSRVNPEHEHHLEFCEDITSDDHYVDLYTFHWFSPEDKILGDSGCDFTVTEFWVTEDGVLVS